MLYIIYIEELIYVLILVYLYVQKIYICLKILENLLFNKNQMI